ncbi:FGRL1 factor, partial [Polypterus senegalus]
MKLLCPVEGDPPPLTMWTKDKRTIHSGWTRFRVLPHGLRIKEVEAEDAGTYICKATNGFGSININYTLIVIAISKSLLVAEQLDLLLWSSRKMSLHVGFSLRTLAFFPNPKKDYFK